MTDAGGSEPTLIPLPEPPPPPAAGALPEPPTSTLPLAPAKKVSSKRQLIPAVIVVALVVIGLIVNGILAKDPPSLPHFAEQRPTYGTIQMTVTYEEQLGGSYTYSSESNAAADVVHIVGSERASALDTTTAPTHFEYLISADEFWIYDFGQQMWMKAAEPDADSYASASSLSLSLMFSDYIPDALRPYVSIESVGDDKVSGHEVKVYDLRLDLAAFHNDLPDVYAEWAVRMGIEKPASNTTMELSVDDAGVAWRMTSFSTQVLGGQTEIRKSDFEQVVNKLLPQEYEVDYPTTYYDEATNQQVG